MSPSPQPLWSSWYCDVRHLAVWKGGARGGGSDVATLTRFQGGFELWIYNTHDECLFTRDDSTRWFAGGDERTLAEAMSYAEGRLGTLCDTL